VSDIDIALVDSLKALDLKWPIREAYIVMGAAVLLGGIVGAFRRAGPSGNARARPSDLLG
jgi:hypothetical protein